MSLTLPGMVQMILYGTVSIAGAVAVYYFGRWAAGWINEIHTKGNATSAGDGRATADSSDQKLNDQTAQLPKD